MTTIETKRFLEQEVERFSKMTDTEQWEYIIQNKENLTLLLDNDITEAYPIPSRYLSKCELDNMTEEEMEDYWVDIVFTLNDGNDLGNRAGIPILLSVLGITAESV